MDRCDNSPHVPVFTPLIKFYRAGGVDVILTARDHSQTVEMLKDHGFGTSFEVIGKHYGKNNLYKVYGTLKRAKQLASYLKKLRHEFDVKVAVSHGSRSMVLAAKWLGIPVITMYDYEFTETKIFNYFSDKVLVPHRISDGVLKEIGLEPAKTIKYEGIKEEIYVNYFQPHQTFLDDLASKKKIRISQGNILVALRPPAATANYHNKEGENLFGELLKFLLSNENTFSIILPRTNAQKIEIEQFIESNDLDSARFFLLKNSVSGLDLVNSADLLISGGGTMNREAVLLGIPVYSIFLGKPGALDTAMEAEGKITFIRRQSDFSKIHLKKLTGKSPASPNNMVEDQVKKQINYYLKE